MNGKVRKIYDDLFDILFNKFNDSNKAYDHLLEFLGVDNCPPIIKDIKDGFGWLFEDNRLCEKIKGAYDLSIFKSDRYDYLGDLYTENVLGSKEAGRKGQFLTPHHIVDCMCDSVLGNADSEKKSNILDPCVGSGRFLITANKYSPNARLFGVDTDLTMVRTSLTNAAIYNLPMFVLHANSLLHETDIALPDGRYNWKFANRWESCIDELRLIGERKKNPIKPTKAEQLS
jgi:type I restriction-modification system DNA methylase subunit